MRFEMRDLKEYLGMRFRGAATLLPCGQGGGRSPTEEEGKKEGEGPREKEEVGERRLMEAEGCRKGREKVGIG